MTQGLGGYREFDFGDDASPAPVKPRRMAIVPLEPVRVESRWSDTGHELARLIARPQRPLRMVSLFIPWDQAIHVEVAAVLVGVDLQFAEPGRVPGELFSWTCGHSDCEGKWLEERESAKGGEMSGPSRVDSPFEALSRMAKCIETHPAQSRAVREWDFCEALPGIEVTAMLCLKADSPFSPTMPLWVHACWLAEVTEYVPATPSSFSPRVPSWLRQSWDAESGPGRRRR